MKMVIALMTSQLEFFMNVDAVRALIAPIVMKDFAATHDHTVIPEHSHKTALRGLVEQKKRTKQCVRDSVAARQANSAWTRST